MQRYTYRREIIYSGSESFGCERDNGYLDSQQNWLKYGLQSVFVALIECTLYVYIVPQYNAFLQGLLFIWNWYNTAKFDQFLIETKICTTLFKYKNLLMLCAMLFEHNKAIQHVCWDNYIHSIKITSIFQSTRLYHKYIQMFLNRPNCFTVVIYA